MRKILRFEECFKKIENLKKETLFAEEKSSKLPELLKNLDPYDKIFIVSDDAVKVIMIPCGSQYQSLYFRKNEFYREKIVETPLRYQNKKCNISCYQVYIHVFSSWLSEYGQEQEKISLDPKDVEALKKHKAKVNSRETTRRHLKDMAYAETVVKEDRDAIEKIFKKYDSNSIEINFQKVLEEEDVVEIQKGESDVFSRYGLKVPSEKTTYKTFCTHVSRNNMSLDALKNISDEDMKVFRKYGITFSPSGKILSNVRAPQPPGMKLAYTMLFLVVFAGVWFFFGAEWQYKLKQFFSQQTEKRSAYTFLTTLEKHVKAVQGNNERSKFHYELLEKEYPPTLGYLEVHPAIPAFLQKSQAKQKYIEQVLKEGRELQNSDHSKFYSWYTKHQDLVNDNLIKIQERAISKLETTLSLNQTLRDSYDREQKIEKSLSNLRGYLLTAGEYLDAIHEKTQMIEEEFASYASQLSVKQELMQDKQKVAEKVKQMQSEALKIEEAVVKVTQGNLSSEKLEEMAEAFYEMDHKDLDNLRLLEDALEENIKAFTKIRDKSAYQNEAKLILAKVSKQSLVMSEVLQNLKEKQQQLNELKKTVNIQDASNSDAMIEQGQKSLGELRSNLEQIEILLQQQKNQEARSLLDASQKLVEVSSKIITATDLVEETIERAKVLKMQQGQKAQKISEILVVIKRIDKKVQRASQEILEELESLKKYPGASSQMSSLQNKISEATNIRENLRQIFLKTQQLLSSNVEESYSYLEQQQSTIATAEKLSVELVKTLGQAKTLHQTLTVAYEKELKTKRVQRIIDKLEHYTTQLKNILTPLEKRAEYIAKFANRRGYPEITSKGQETLDKSRKILALYTQRMKAAQELRSQDLDQALARVVVYEGKPLSPANFSRDLKELQQELSQKVLEINALNKHSEQRQEVDVIITELEQRQQQLKVVITALRENLNKLSGVAGAPSNDYSQYVQEGQQELKELGEILEIAERYIKEGKFRAAVDLLSPYSQKQNPGLSRLPLLITLQNSTARTLDKLKNPEERAKMEARMAQQKQRNDYIKKFSKAPGSWYLSIQQIITEYEQLQEKIANSLKGRGSYFVHSAIDIEARKIKEYPSEIGEVEYILFLSQKHQEDVLKDLEDRRKEKLEDYIKTKKIAISVEDEQRKIRGAINDLKQELETGGWVEEETLRELLRNLKSVERKYREEYQEIKSPLINAEARIQTREM